MAGLIGALRVTLGLDSAQFEAGTKRARGVAQRDSAAIQKSLSGIKTSLNGLMAAGAVTALVTAGKRALDYAGSLSDVSKQLGVTTRDLQVYRFIATQVGLTQDEMDKTLGKLTETMGKASLGSKAHATAFRELGVSVLDANGKLVTAEIVIPRIADAFTKIKDPATRARLATALFGEAGQKLDPLLTQGAKGIAAMTKRSKELGLVIGDDLIKSADAAGKRLDELQKQLETNFARAMANSADAVVGLANAFATLTSSALNFVNQYPKISGALAGAAAGARFGAPGALIGAAGGALGGMALEKSQANGNMTVGFRAQALKGAIADWRKAKQGGDPLSDPGSKVGAGARGVNQARVSAAWAEVERQKTLFDQATAPQAPSAGPVGSGALPVASGGVRRRGGSHARDRSSDYLKRYERELSGLQDDQLQLQQDITTDIHEKARLEHQRLETAQAAYEHEVDTKQSSGELTAAQAQALKDAYALNDLRKHTLVNWRLDDQLSSDELDLRRSALENTNTLLQGELASARTQADRRRLQLAILANEQALERASLEAVLAKHESTETEKQIARAKLAQLDKEFGQRATSIRRDTMGPLEAQLDSLPKSAAEINEAFEAVAANGIQSMTDGIADAIASGKSLADVFKNVANQIIADLIRIAVQKTITNAIGGALDGLFGGGLKAGSIKSPLSGLKASLPGLATGGSFKIGGPGVDNQVLSVGGIPRAMVSGSETVHVTPANDRGGGGRSPIIVNMNGVMTVEDFWGRIQAMDAQAAAGGAQIAQGRAQRVARRRLV